MFNTLFNIDILSCSCKLIKKYGKCTYMTIFLINKLEKLPSLRKIRRPKKNKISLEIDK